MNCFPATKFNHLRQVVAVPLSRLTPAEISDIIAQVEQAKHHYNGWAKALLSRIVCGPRSLAAFPEDIHCGWQDFEKWYTGDSATRFLNGLPAYSGIAKHLQAVRTYASILLGQPQVASPIEQSVFDAFMEQSHLLEWQVWRLHQEVRDLLSAIDPLTGVSSRKGMISRLQQEQQRVRRTPDSHCVIGMMDFDHFKEINDTYGHQAGDHVLQAAVSFVVSQLRNYDLIYRYGGEEFLICLPATSLKQAKKTLERVKNGLEAMPITLDSGAEARVTASFGISLLEDSALVEEVIARCDKALYQAKQNGRNRIVVWRPVQD